MGEGDALRLGVSAQRTELAGVGVADGGVFQRSLWLDLVIVLDHRWMGVFQRSGVQGK